jgi:YVTN family beta-propeller protein
MRAKRRARSKRRRTVGGAIVLCAVAAGAVAAGLWLADSDPVGATETHAVRHAGSGSKLRPSVRRLAARRIGSLPAPLQDAAIAAVGNKAVLLGGLDAADTSTSDVRVVSGGRTRTIGRMPRAFHDAAAVALGGTVYVFGGGDGIRQLDQIVAVDPLTGRPHDVGRLPAPSSDHAAAVVDGTAYVVGGYTGSAWLDTIVAWRPGQAARVVGRLPAPIRYAAVTGAAGRVVIAGGSLPDGSASRAVYSFDPESRTVQRVGTLPAPTTHAAGATVGTSAFVIGGRGARVGTPTGRIVVIDPLRRLVHAAGRLLTPLSDVAATELRSRIVIAGGRGQAASVELASLVPARHGSAHAARASKAANVYAFDGANALSPVVRNVPPRVYVPNSGSNTVDVIDQRTFKVIAHYVVGQLPQHVTPSYDLKTLWVDNDGGNSLTPVSPKTGRPDGHAVRVEDPYNLYFTPGGRYAIVVAERNHRLDFRFAHTMRLHHSLDVPCQGVDHLDFTADGRYLLASCEFSGEMLRVDVVHERVTGVLKLPRHFAMPQDVKLSPDGRVFYVADMASNGVWKIDATRLRILGFIHTGLGAHGLYPSRDARLLYVTNRNEGTISVLDFASGRPVTKWHVGGSPDMGGVSADGKVLWLSGRYNAQVYAISTKDGRVLARIPVGYGPHGVCVWPQPGRYSLGHTGILR